MPFDFDLTHLRGILPLQSLLQMGKLIVLSAKEAQSLMDIWEGYTDTFGRKTVPSKVDHDTVKALIDKGMIETDSLAAGVVRLTGKGRSFIRKEILGREISSFDQQTRKKVASRLPQQQGHSWLARAMRNG